jgi:hypothetical protein
MNLMTYAGKPLLFKPGSYYKLRSGCRPSYSQFLASRADIVDIMGTTDKATLILQSSDGTAWTIPDMYLAQYTYHINTSVAEDPFAQAEIILADERLIWERTLCTLDWNLSNDTAITTLADCVSIDDILTSIFETHLGYAAGDWYLDAARLIPPFQVIGQGRSCADVLEEILYNMGLYLVFNPTANATYKIEVLDCLDLEAAGDITWIDTYKPYRTSFSEKLVLVPNEVNCVEHDDTGTRSIGAAKTVSGGLGDIALASMYPAAFLDADGLNDYRDEILLAHRRSYEFPSRQIQLAGWHELTTDISRQELICRLEAQGAIMEVITRRPLDIFRPAGDTFGTHQKYFAGAGTGGDPIELTWYKVVIAPEWADPENIDTAAGIASYMLRPLTDGTPLWLIGTTYLPDTYVTWPADALTATPPVVGRKYKAIEPLVDPVDNVGLQPDENVDYWELQTELEVTHALGTEERDLRLFVPWFKVGGQVPVVQTNYGEGTIDYIWVAMTYCGTDAQASIRWNQVDGRAMACFK